jgi:hypothetical protein
MMERCRRCSMPRRRCDGPTLVPRPTDFCHCCGADRPWKVYMTEHEWHTSTDAAAMLRVAQDHGISARKLRLLACAVLRAAGAVAAVSDNRHALQIAEDFADGLLSEEAFEHEHTVVPPNLMSEFLLLSDPLLIIRSVLEHEALSSMTDAAPALLRDLLGNPFRVVPPLWPDVMSWAQSLARGWAMALAQTIYDDRTYADLTVLADALEDAGCDNDALLDHLRSPGPHARGCWALDLILGKE